MPLSKRCEQPNESNLREFEEQIRQGVKAGIDKYFEGCLPVEIIAERGEDSLAFGPMRPIGLMNPHDGSRAYAVLQLRQDNLAGSLYNMVGFQTNLTFPEQKRVFRMIPGLENAEFERYGQMHRNTFIASPLAPSTHLAAAPARRSVFRRPDHRRGRLYGQYRHRSAGRCECSPVASRKTALRAAHQHHAGCSVPLYHLGRFERLPTDESQFWHSACRLRPACAAAKNEIMLHVSIALEAVRNFYGSKPVGSQRGNMKKIIDSLYLIASSYLVIYCLQSIGYDRTASNPARQRSKVFDGQRAWQDVVKQVEMGPRIPGSQAHCPAGGLGSKPN